MSFAAPFTSSQQESNELEEVCDMCPKLTYQQRIMGFCLCCGLGYMLSFAGTMVLVTSGPSAEAISTFAALYVIGNLIAIAATLFLIGPKKQCTKMFDKTRRFATMFWLATLIATFAIAVAKVNVGWVVFMILIQISASIWYSASYIPYGRRFILQIFQSTCCKPCPTVCDPLIKINS
mmetsp:Transcript_915/g.3115  ORF Transcript_915/g.3115 Transcript_915/m.3115 type:complete len:178 (+) Transcript_915:71-604(+)|eukprot:CAMPEP_0118919710 /NCGR_PEP_ID=MMETSP1166-20130328/18698_1 /TAXON_ID=1104430 /ORGANISM="Chrysoreinhardia sp, Strain CCMP3193" /LENGTH=177 /DNA_ID=CAMNT_0006860239 /DNA_START=58 /DNA_END=591 /DNA_ORIENTATION=+